MKLRNRKRVLSFVLAIAMLLGLCPQMTNPMVASAASNSVTLYNIGDKGTLKVGSKTKKGDWYKMRLNNKDFAFCMTLGATCHSGDVYEDSEAVYNSSDGGKKGLKACIGYWYAEKMNRKNKAWVFAQALFWGVQEDETSESAIKANIKAMKDNTGYFSSKTVNELYNEIFAVSGVEKITVTEWRYAGSSKKRQALMQIKSDSYVDYHPKSVHYAGKYRQYLELDKVDEDHVVMPGAKFTVEALDLDNLYSYKINAEDTEEVEDDIDDFTIQVTTDANGQVKLRFVYQIQTQEYYYYTSDQLDAMTADQKKKAKEDLDDEDLKYASDLTYDGAMAKMDAEFVKKLEHISNQYVIKEIDSGNSNITLNPDFVNGKTVILDQKNSSWKYGSVDGSWGAYSTYVESIADRYKKVTVKLNKKDDYSSDGKAYGDATLEGALYTLYADEACTTRATIYDRDSKELHPADDYQTSTGSLETDYLRCGTTYYLKEVQPPVGYLQNDQVIPINVSGDGIASMVEYTPTKEVKEQREPHVKGYVSIQKYMTEDTDTAGVLKGEKGAVSQVYLQSKGSYDACSDYERDTITTDENGYARTHELYYGEYKVEQISSGDSDTQMVANLETVFVSQHEKTYNYSILNPVFKAYLRVIKKDKNTEKNVLKPGTTYQIKKVDKETGEETLVRQSYSDGNSIKVVDTFTSDATGTIMTVKPLVSGTYRIYETDSASGLHITTEYIEVDINSKSDLCKYETDENGYTHIIVEQEYVNEETYGKLKLYKTGEMLLGYQDDKFVFENAFLKGNQFEVYAAEDIVTQDNQGTNWYDKGDLVATITSGEGAEFTKDCKDITGYVVDEDGTVTLNLPLGKYHVKEKKTLYGYILPEKGWNVEFNWENKDEEYVLNATDATDEDGVLNVENMRAKSKLSLVKTDVASGSAIEGAIFGLYTRDEIFNADGEKIVDAGTLLEKVTTDQDGKASTDMDLPLMSEGYKEAIAATGSAVTGAAVNASSSAVTLNSGDYYFKEISVSDSFYLSEQEYPVHLEYKNQETAIISDKVEATNEQTDVIVSKISITNSQELAGCNLEITDADGRKIVTWTSGNKESIVLMKDLESLGYRNVTVSMDDKGNLQVKGLLHDAIYTMTETRPVDGFVTADSISFQLREGEDGKTIVVAKNADSTYAAQTDNVVRMVDDTTKVEISKTDIAGSDEIEGCELEIKDQETDTVIDSWTSTEEKHIIEQSLVVGKTYILSEKRPADGYTTADAIDFTVADTGEVQGVHMEDDTTKIRLIKLASDTGQGLPGAKFEVYDSQGEKVLSFTSNEEGYDITGKLKIGETYTFKEIKAPKGYELSKDVTYTVKDTGDIQKVSVTDKKTPTPHVPQTGGTTPLIFAFIAFIALVGGGYLVYRKKRVAYGKTK